MHLNFTKMNGLGNDFILIDNRDRRFDLSAALIERLCDRRTGIGADGLMLIEPAGGSDFFMRFYNSDGGEAEMCGNGSRCAAHYAVSLGLGKEREGRWTVRFETLAGPLEAWVQDWQVAVTMMDTKEMRLHIPLQVAGEDKIVHFIIAATRHVVVPVDDAVSLTDEQVEAWGRELRYKPEFGPIGANVNFVSRLADGGLAIRTYEKGVEAVTHACGTGSIASAVILSHLDECRSPVRVRQRRGDILNISFERQPFGASRVVLEGPVAVNFEGATTID